MIRVASLDDFDKLFEIYMQPDVVQYLSFESMSKREFKPVFEALISSGEMLAFEEDHKIVATCILHRGRMRNSHVVKISTFAVSTERQSYGVGSNFFEQVLTLIKEDKNVIRVELTVESDNLEAIRFYKKFGFEIEGTLKKWFKRKAQQHYIDEHLMGLLL